MAGWSGESQRGNCALRAQNLFEKEKWGKPGENWAKLLPVTPSPLTRCVLEQHDVEVKAVNQLEQNEYLVVSGSGRLIPRWWSQQNKKNPTDGMLLVLVHGSDDRPSHPVKRQKSARICS